MRALPCPRSMRSCTMGSVRGRAARSAVAKWKGRGCNGRMRCCSRAARGQRGEREDRKSGKEYAAGAGQECAEWVSLLSTIVRAVPEPSAAARLRMSDGSSTRTDEGWGDKGKKDAWARGLSSHPSSSARDRPPPRERGPRALSTAACRAAWAVCLQ